MRVQTVALPTATARCLVENSSGVTTNLTIPGTPVDMKTSERHRLRFWYQDALWRHMNEIEQQRSHELMGIVVRRVTVNRNHRAR